MDWKKFLKLNLSKISLTIFIFLLIVFLPVIPIIRCTKMFCPHNIIFNGFVTGYTSLFNMVVDVVKYGASHVTLPIMLAILVYLVILLITLFLTYLASCTIIHMYNKFKINKRN